MEQQSIIEKSKIIRWRGYGHVLMPDQRIPKQVMQWRSAGSRRIGRPKYTWQRTTQRDMVEKTLDRADVEARVGTAPAKKDSLVTYGPPVA